jgi:plasmid stability protein
MAAITLKSLPKPLHRQLKARAARHKRSLNQEVIAVLEEAVADSRPVDSAALIEEARRFRDSLTLTVTPDEIATFKTEGRA